MKSKRFVSAVLAVLLLAGAGWVLAAGGADDPLITKTYMDGVYVPALKAEVDAAVTAFKAGEEQQLNAARSGSYRFSTVAAGESVTYQTGSIFMPVSGSGTVSITTGVLIDVTEGRELTGTAALAACHRYLPAEDTIAVVTAVQALTIAADGENGEVSLFSDVKESDWFYADVMAAVELGLINGMGNGLYGPNANFTVAQAVKVAACIHQYYFTGAVTFTGSGAQWYEPYAAYALSNGIIAGTYEDWNAAITREQFVDILYNALPYGAYTTINSVANNAIPDVAVGDNCWQKIYMFYRAGILVGDTAHRFHPADPIRRSEVAAILTRMMDPTARQSVTLN